MGAGARPASDPAPGLRLPGRYRVCRHIATGGMASVWCAEDRVLGRSVAIKVLAERFAHDELAVRRFKREARAAARVSAHPHVVTIFDVGDTEPGPDQSPPDAELGVRVFIVMEHLDGGTVADAIRAGAISRQEAIRWLREAASALDHAHQRGIVHRDIKPANFLLDEGRSLHVADFGIARLMSEDTITSSGELFGTAAYLAPEQALGRDATSASDRYALAVAAFELLTGGRPFTASHFAAQARQHIDDEPPRASERDRTLPPAIDGVLARGMAKEPAARYPSAGAFVQALESSLRHEATPATAATDAAAATAATRVVPRPDAPRTAPPARAASPARAAPPPTASPRTPRPAPSRPRRSGRAGALAALAVVALGVAVLIIQLQGGSGTSRSASAPRARALAATPGRVRRSTSTAARSSPTTAASTSTPTSASTSASTSSSASASTASSTPTAPTATGSPSTLQLQGHQELLSGSYPAAIATLRQAVAGASPGSLTYAYALYDLGHALLLSGNPQAAVSVLEQRLKIPNQTAVVQQLLNQARQASGSASAAPAGGSSGPGSAGSGPAADGGHSKGHGNGGGGA